MKVSILNMNPAGSFQIHAAPVFLQPTKPVKNFDPAGVSASP
jgi:hypothetical protein